MIKKPLITFVVIALLSGFVLYFLTDNTLIITKPIYDTFSISNPILSVDNDIIGLLRNYGLDFLWAFAMCIAVYIALYSFKHPVIIAIVVTLLLGTVLEILQLLKLIHGTFDIIDIASEAIGCVCASFVIQRVSLRADKR